VVQSQFPDAGKVRCHLASFVAVMGDNAVRIQQAVSFTQWLANLGVAAAAGWTIFRVTGSRWHGLLAAGFLLPTRCLDGTSCVVGASYARAHASCFARSRSDGEVS